jgi:hypothetical protein
VESVAVARALEDGRQSQQLDRSRSRLSSLEASRDRSGDFVRRQLALGRAAEGRRLARRARAVAAVAAAEALLVPLCLLGAAGFDAAGELRQLGIPSVLITTAHRGRAAAAIPGLLAGYTFTASATDLVALAAVQVGLGCVPLLAGCRHDRRRVELLAALLLATVRRHAPPHTAHTRAPSSHVLCAPPCV